MAKGIDRSKVRVTAVLFMVFAVALTASLFGLPQGEPHSSVEVRVRVSEGGRFVPGLTLDDFEIYEDGRLQEAGSLYLVEGQDIVGREERRAAAPHVHRNFTLLFQATDWNPKLAETVDHLFQSLILPGDSMTLVTPMKTYSLAPEALARKPKASISNEMQQILRKDIQNGGGEYREALRDLRRLVGAIGGTGGRSVEADMEIDAAGSSFGLEMQLERYKQSLLKLESLRLLEQKKLLGFAGALKNQPGQSFVFFFYQREFRPEISTAVLNSLMNAHQDAPNIMGDLQDLFMFYRRDTRIGADLIRRAFADAGASFNFIFMNKEAQRLFGANMREQSEDVFSLMSEISRATGGIADNSQSPVAAFRRAAEASREFYILTYVPENRDADGGFRKIEVRIKGRDYRVESGTGYYAR